MKKVRLADIAGKTGVSIQHVSRALTGNGRIARETRERIREQARRMGYFDTPQTGYIAVLSPFDLDDWNVLCLDVLRAYGRKGILLPFREFTAHDEHYFDGAIYTNGVDRVEQIWYSDFQIPLITINRYGNSMEQIESVLPDADGEMRMALEHLAGLGHRKIVRLHPTNLTNTRRNVTRGEVGFFRAAEELGIRNSVRNETYDPAEKVKEILPRLLQEGFTAFIVVADPDHQRILDIFRQCGKRIPEDVSLVVYEIDLPPELGLTAVKIENRRVLETGIQLFLEKLAGHPIPVQTIVPSTFNIRNSTGRVHS